MWHIFSRIGQLLWQLSYTPSIIKNSIQHRAHTWFPDFISPVCRSGDFTCYQSNGLMKLADILPNGVMDGLDLLADNKNKILGGVFIGATTLTAYWGYKRWQGQKPRPLHQQQLRSKQRPKSV